MKVIFARKVDYWVGIPICFFLSLFYGIKRTLMPSGIPEGFVPKKIIFLELSEMGSAILSYSAIKRAKEMYPSAKLYFWIFKENAESVYILNILPKENVITISSKNIYSLFIDTIKSLKRIRKERIDTVIDMELFSRFTSILAFLSGAKARVGFYKFRMEGLYRANTYTHKVAYNPYMHISRNFLALVNSLAVIQDEPLLKMPLVDIETTIPKQHFGKEQDEAAWFKLREINKQISRENKIIILNLDKDKYMPLREWPFENYMNLAKNLLETKENFIVLVGLWQGGDRLNKAIALLDSNRVINIIGMTSMRELLFIFNLAHLFISHDCGAVNLASLTTINMIVLFGPETPTLYAPLNPNKTVFYKHFACSPCFSAYNHRVSICKNNLCLQAISVFEVHQEAKRYLSLLSSLPVA